MIAEARPAETVRGHLAAGRLEEAEAAAAAEVERRPTVAGWRTVAAVRLRRGRPDAALAALARAEALAPSDPDVAIDSGVVHRSAGRFAEAAIAFERAAQAAPGRADAWTRLADAAIDAGDLALAGRAVERARTIDPAAAAARLAAGRLAMRRRRFADALAAVAPVADGPRPDPAALELAGRALAALGDDAGAACSFARGFAAERQV
ncbi:MAG: tetratricopeptide repeat protein, partial [Alphaproteobacteria bacterium]